MLYLVGICTNNVGVHVRSNASPELANITRSVVWQRYSLKNQKVIEEWLNKCVDDVLLTDTELNVIMEIFKNLKI